MNTRRKIYAEARVAGYRPVDAWRVAKTVEHWRHAEAAGHVRLLGIEETDSYFDVYGKPEPYVNGYGRRVSAAEAEAEQLKLLERWGCVAVMGQVYVSGRWESMDSISMCVYEDALDWRQNWYVPDIMATTLRKGALKRLREGAAVCA